MNFLKKIDDVNSDNTVTVLYKIGLLIFIPLILLFIFLGTDTAVKLLISETTVCAFRRITGFNCPGCGGTRATLYLARLRFLDSFKMNASVPVGMVLYLFFMIRQTFTILFSGKIRSLKEKHVYILLGIFLATIFINWIVNNVV